MHQPEGLPPLRNGGELAALICWSFALVVVLGPYPWALDALIRRRRGEAVAPVSGRTSAPG